MSGLFLYALTLVQTSHITVALPGQFSGVKQQELLVARGSILELFKVDSNAGKVGSST